MQDVSVNYVKSASLHMNKKERKWNDGKREKVFTQDYVSYVLYAAWKQKVQKPPHVRPCA